MSELKLVSFSLYGTDQKYFRGAIMNGYLVQELYPGWVMRVYCTDDADKKTITKLKRLGCQIEYMGVSHDQSGMLWRFLPAWEPGVERVIFRDTDSRITPREVAAVNAWVKSGKVAHVMQDHHHHGRLPICGGMWGVVGEFLPNMTHLWARFMSDMQRRVTDMKLMKAHVWPHIKHDTLRHSSVPTSYGDSFPFPSHASCLGFVGQQLNADDSCVWPKVDLGVSREYLDRQEPR